MEAIGPPVTGAAKAWVGRCRWHEDFRTQFAEECKASHAKQTPNVWSRAIPSQTLRPEVNSHSGHAQHSSSHFHRISAILLLLLNRRILFISLADLKAAVQLITFDRAYIYDGSPSQGKLQLKFEVAGMLMAHPAPSYESLDSFGDSFRARSSTHLLLASRPWTNISYSIHLPSMLHEC